MRQGRNRRRFTEQGVERLRYDPAAAPPSGRMEIEDEVCPGLLLRVTPRGAKSFSVIYKVPGEGGVSPTGRLLAGSQRRITLGATPPLALADARQQARDIIKAATEGRDPRGERREQNLHRHSNTFDTVLDRFMEQAIKPKVRAWRNVERVLRLHVKPAWGSTPLVDIRRSDVHELLDTLVSSGRKGTAREVRKHLSRLFNWAIDREIITDSPAHGLRRDDLHQEEEAGRALTDGELRLAWAATGQMGYPFGPLYRLLMLTGQRRGEWAGASRSEINSNRRWLEVPRQRYKGRRDHIVPLPDTAWGIVDALPAWPGNDYFLLSSRGGRVPVSGFSKAKARLDELMLEARQKEDPEAALVDFRVHDLRVTCETRLASLGFNQEVRDAVLGHAKPGLQGTYNKHDYLGEKQAALGAYEAHLMEIV
jgi:integrase